VTDSDNSDDNPNTEDKMSWKPGDVVWTKKAATTAHKLADRIRKTKPAK